MGRKNESKLIIYPKQTCVFYLQGVDGDVIFFRVTGPFCGEFTGHRCIPLTMASDAELWCFCDQRLQTLD